MPPLATVLFETNLSCRPISLTCSLSKVFEKVIYNKIYPFINEKLSENQHGFRESDSTLSNVLDYYNIFIYNRTRLDW